LGTSGKLRPTRADQPPSTILIPGRCFVGGHLAKAGNDVTFVGRERLKTIADEKGITITPLFQDSFQIDCRYVTTMDLDKYKPDFIILTVKSSATEQTARDMVACLKDSNYKPIVLSLQNGLENPAILSKILQDKAVVVPGMFSFNVVEAGTKGQPGQSSTHFKQASSGPVYAQDVPEIAPLVKAMKDANLDVHTSPAIKLVMYGKLLMNLNNCTNALSGLPLKMELSQGSYRRVTSFAVSEALAVYAALGITPVSPSPLPSWTLPWVLAMPDWLFLRIAKQTLSIDDEAYSSMYDDLRLGRKETEIDQLNGEIVRLGKTVNVPTPVNERLTQLIKEAVANRKDHSWKTWTGDDLLAHVLSP
jgi:2-dehydropantoate 2-reductase